MGELNSGIKYGLWKLGCATVSVSYCRCLSYALNYVLALIGVVGLRETNNLVVILCMHRINLALRGTANSKETSVLAVILYIYVIKLALIMQIKGDKCLGRDSWYTRDKTSNS